MSRFRRSPRVVGGHSIKINGQLLNVHYARIVYKCAECFGDLERHDFGLRCQNDHGHRHFIHRDEAEKIRASRCEQLDEIEAAYEIINDQIVYKE